MKYLSVCSGIEAATVAWKPLGWRMSVIYMGDIANWHFYWPDRHGGWARWEMWVGPWLILFGAPR